MVEVMAELILKVLAYWNLNFEHLSKVNGQLKLKVLAYWV